MNIYKVYVNSDHSIKDSLDAFVSAFGNGTTVVQMIAPFDTSHTEYALFKKPNGLSPERYLMNSTSNTESVEVSGNDEEWNIWQLIIPSPVFDIDSADSQNVLGQFEDWYFVPEDDFQGIVQLSTSLFTTFDTAVDGDFARVVNTNTDWQLNEDTVATSITAGEVCKIVSVGTTDFTAIGASSNTVGTVFTATGVGTGTGVVDSWIDLETTIVGMESRTPTGTYNIPVDPSIDTGLPTIAPDNTELIIGILNGKISTTEAADNYVNQDISIYSEKTTVAEDFLLYGNDSAGNPCYFTTQQLILDVSGYQLTSEKGEANGYAPLDSNAKVPRDNLPSGTKVFKGSFGSVSGDLPTVDVEIGDTYTCETDNYDSTVAGQDFDKDDTATWSGTAWIKNQADSEEIEQKIKFIDVTQDATDKYKFYCSFDDAELYDHRIWYAHFPDTINEDTTDSDVLLSINGGTTYSNLTNVLGANVTVDEAFKRGSRIVFVYDIDATHWTPLLTDKDFLLLAGSGWSAGENVKGNYDDNRVQDSLIADIINALGAGGQIVRQVTDLTVPTTVTSTETQLVFDTVTTSTNDSTTLTVDGNNDVVLNSENTAGFSLSALASVLGTQTNPNTISTVRFNCYVNGSATPCDTFDVTVGKDETVNKTKITTYIVPVGDAPDTVTIKAQLISGSADISSFTITVQSLFTISGGTPGPASTSTTTIASTSTEMLTPIAGGKQEDANEQFVAKLNEIGKVQNLVEVSLGQFKIDSNNPIATNNLYNFKFPTASADADLDVEVSVDNGTTYYDVEYQDTEVDLKVLDISGKKVSMYYNSTAFIVTNIDAQVETAQNIHASIDSTVGTATPNPNYSPKFDVIKGASGVQENINGNVDASATYSAGNYFGNQDDGTLIQWSGSYNTSFREFNVISGNKYFIKFKLKNDSVGLIRNTIAVQYSSGSTQTLGTDTEIDLTEYYGILTANNTDSIIVFTRVGTAGQVDKDEIVFIPITNTIYETKTADELNAIFTTYFEGAQDVVNPSILTRGSNLNDGEYELGDISVVDGSNTSSTIKLRTINQLKVKPNTNYIVSGIPSGRIYEYDINGEYVGTIGSLSGTLSNSTYYIRFRWDGTTTQDLVIMLNEGTTALDYVEYNAQEQTFTNVDGSDLHLRSVGDIQDRITFKDNAWYKEGLVDIATGVSIGATINTTTIPTISLTSKFVAIDETNGEVQFGDYGDVLTLTNTASVYFALATQVDTLIDSDGGIIQDTITTVSQSQTLPAELDILWSENADSALSNTQKRVSLLETEMASVESSLASSVASIESDIDDIETNIGDIETDIDNIETKTDFITVTQAVDLDAMESDISDNETDITNIETKTDYITVGANVNLNKVAEWTVLMSTSVNVDDSETLPTSTNVTISEAFTNFDFIALEIEYVVQRKLVIIPVIDTVLDAYPRLQVNLDDYVVFLFDNSTTTTFYAYKGTYYNVTTGTSPTIVPSTNGNIDINKIYGIKL